MYNKIVMILLIFLSFLLIACQNRKIASAKPNIKKKIPPQEPTGKIKHRPIEEIKETFDGRLYRIYNAPPIKYQGE